MLEARGIVYHVLHQRAGEAIITAPGTYHQGFNMTNNLAEAANFALEEWLPLNYSFCTFSCTGFSQSPPMNLSAHRKYESEFRVNALESCSLKLFFQIQQELGNEHRLNKETDKHGQHVKAKAIVGGDIAQKLMRLAIGIADARSLAWLVQILRSTRTLGQTATSSMAEPLGDAALYNHILVAKAGVAHANLRSRSAALLLSRRIKEAFEKAENSVAHRKGTKRCSIGDIVESTAGNILKALGDEDKRLITGFQRAGENSKSVVCRHLREMYDLGERLELLVQIAGERVIYCITGESYQEYVVHPPSHMRMKGFLSEGPGVECDF